MPTQKQGEPSGITAGTSHDDSSAKSKGRGRPNQWQTPVRDHLFDLLRHRMTVEELAEAAGMTTAAAALHLGAMTVLPLPPLDGGRTRADVQRWLDLRTGIISYRRNRVGGAVRRHARDEIVRLHPRLGLSIAVKAARAVHVAGIVARSEGDLAAARLASPLKKSWFDIGFVALRAAGLDPASPYAGIQYLRRVVEDANYGLALGDDQVISAQPTVR